MRHRWCSAGWGYGGWTKCGGNHGFCGCDQSLAGRRQGSPRSTTLLVGWPKMRASRGWTIQSGAAGNHSLAGGHHSAGAVQSVDERAVLADMLGGQDVGGAIEQTDDPTATDGGLTRAMWSVLKTQVGNWLMALGWARRCWRRRGALMHQAAKVVAPSLLSRALPAIRLSVVKPTKVTWWG